MLEILKILSLHASFVKKIGHMRHEIIQRSRKDTRHMNVLEVQTCYAINDTSSEAPRNVLVGRSLKIRAQTGFF